MMNENTPKAAQKPRNSISFLPDPSKWIQTGPSSSSSSSSTKKPPQRPLAAFRNGIPTPPPTTLKRNTAGQSTSKKLDIWKDVMDSTERSSSRTGLVKQRSLSGFLNTPTSASRKGKEKEEPVDVNSNDHVSRRKDRIEEGSTSAKRRGSPSVVNTITKSPLRPQVALRGYIPRSTAKSKLISRADDFGSSDSEILLIDNQKSKSNHFEGPGHPSHATEVKSKIVPLKAHRSAPASSSSGMSDAIDAPPSTTTRKRSISMSNSRKSKRRRSDKSRTRSVSPTKPLHPSAYETPSPPNLAMPLPPDKQEGSTRLMIVDRQGNVPTASATNQPALSTPHLPPHPSSDRPITPVPDHILDIHRRLCGQDINRTKRIKSPWRTTPSPPPASISKKRKMDPVTSHQLEITSRAFDKFIEKKRRVESIDSDEVHEKEKKLVTLSSSDSVDIENQITPDKKKKSVVEGVLSPLAANTFRRMERVSSKTIPSEGDVLSPVSRRRQQPVRVPVSPLPHTSSVRLSKSSSKDLGIDFHHHPRYTQKLLSTELDNELLADAAQPRHSPSSRCRTIHHSVVSPKATTTTKQPCISSRLHNTPSPPPPPLFSSSPTKRPNPKGFKPVQMEVETLMTWSPAKGSRDGKLPSSEINSGNAKSSPTKLHNFNQPLDDTTRTPTKRRPLFISFVESESLAQSEPSQSFPILLPSPSDKSKSSKEVSSAHVAMPSELPGLNRQTSSKVLVKETMSSTSVGDRRDPPHQLGKKSTILPETVFHDETKEATTGSVRNNGEYDASASRGQSRAPTLRRSKSSWPRFDSSDITDVTPTRPEIPDRIHPLKRKPLATQTSQSGGKQSKLAQFGFFTDTPTRNTSDFEKKWDEEEDLAFDVEEGITHSPARISQQNCKTGDKSLGPVPDAPYHPSLRPAGIKEFHRREKLAERVLSSQPTRDQDQKEASGDEKQSIAESPTAHEPVFALPSSPLPLLISTDAEELSSSLTTDSELGGGIEMNESTREWWEGLGNRRSSEFGSLN